MAVFVVCSLWQIISQSSALARLHKPIEDQPLLSRIWISFFQWLDAEEEEQGEVKDSLV